jgi:hypothetical protein
MNYLRKAVKFIAASISLFVAIATIYVFFWPQNKSEITLKLLSQNKILEVSDAVADLRLLYKDNDLRLTKQNLMLYTVKLENTGKENILMDAYDERDMPGIRVSNGNILESPALLETSSQYLKDRVSLIVESENTIRLKPVILEAGEFFVFKFAVLFAERNAPSITTIGKIAGVSHIPVVNVAELRHESDRFSSRQYLFVMVFLFAAIVLFSAMIVSHYWYSRSTSDKKKDQHRKEREEIFSVFRQKQPTFAPNFMDLLHTHYVYSDEKPDRTRNEFKKLESFLSSADTLKRCVPKALEQKRLSDELYKEYEESSYPLGYCDTLLKQGIITVEDETVTVRADFLELLTKFNEYLTYSQE